MRTKLAASSSGRQNGLTINRPDLQMLRILALCATLTALLVTTLLPMGAEASSRCPSTLAFEDVCVAPGVALPTRAPVKKPCFTCTVPAARDLSVQPRVTRLARIAPDDAPAPSRPVRPDLRPPRA